MSKKDLVILGAYPSSEKSKKILKDCISSLGDNFDIMVCTHYPVDVETQNMIKYYIYDYRNEMIINEDVFIYGDCDKFYFQGYIEGSANHPGFAIYRSIMNGLRFAKDYYKKFYYIESDSVFSNSDIEKIKNLTNQSQTLGKRGWFFELDTVLNSNIFCCDIDFFLEIFPHCKTVDDYSDLCNRVGSFGILENFLYCVINNANKLNDLLTIKNFHFTKYFNESKMCLATYREDGMVYPFELRIVKVENTDKIAYVYVNDNVNSTDEKIDFKINSIISKKLPLSRTYTSEIIDSDSDVFIMTVGNYTRKYTRDEIFKSRSFVRFK